MYTIYSILLYILLLVCCLYIKDDYKHLFNLITGLLCIYPVTSSVDSDFSLVKSIKTKLNTNISNMAFEGCIHSKQFNYLIKIKIFLYNFLKI